MTTHGRPLCPVHTREVHWRMPGPEDRAEGRQCTARTQEGKQCPHWTVTDTDRPLCWMHAHPDEHPQIRHGYYRARPTFSETEWAAIDFFMARGRLLEAEVLITRLQILRLFEYLSRSERPLAQNHNSVRLIFKGCRTVGNLVMARKALAKGERRGEELDWAAAALALMEEGQIEEYLAHFPPE